MIVPAKINVGFQKRNDTYTGQLGYVIYYDEKGTLRKEISWQSWRDHKIDPMEFDNTPTEGFVVNKGNTGRDYSWYERNPFIRVYDPRGFEFEISLPNLILLMNYCSFDKGKGIVGKCAYAWEGTSLFLLPIESEEYKKAYAEFNREKKKFKVKDLKPGMILVTKGEYKQNYTYLGRLKIHEPILYSSKILSTGTVDMEEKEDHLFVRKNKDDFMFKHIKITQFDDCIGQENIDEYLEAYNKKYFYSYSNLEFVFSEPRDDPYYWTKYYPIDSKNLMIYYHYGNSVIVSITNKGFSVKYLPEVKTKELKEKYNKEYKFISIKDVSTDTIIKVISQYS